MPDPKDIFEIIKNLVMGAIEGNPIGSILLFVGIGVVGIVLKIWVSKWVEEHGGLFDRDGFKMNKVVEVILLIILAPIALCLALAWVALVLAIITLPFYCNRL